MQTPRQRRDIRQRTLCLRKCRFDLTGKMYNKGKRFVYNATIEEFGK